MLAKTNRFKGQNSLKYLFKKGGTIRGRLVSTRFLHNPKTSDYRAAVVVSKKITKSAPKRNRIRRRIYEIVRLNGPKYLKNHDIAFIVFSDQLANMEHSELESLIVDQLKQISKSAKK